MSDNNSVVDESSTDAPSMERTNSETVRIMNNESPEYVLEHSYEEFKKVGERLKQDHATKHKTNKHHARSKSNANNESKPLIQHQGTALDSESDEENSSLHAADDLEDDVTNDVSDIWYQQTMDKFKSKPWYLRPTVFTLLLVLVLRVMCITLLMTPTVGLLSAKLCNEFEVKYSTTCDMKKVQIEQSNITSVVSLLVSIIGISLSGKYGELSDRLGRLFVLKLVGVIGVVHTALMLVAFHPKTPFNRYLVIFAMSSDITGGILTLISVGNSYISDIIPPSEGTLAGYISLLMSVIYGSIGFGPLLSSYIIKLFKNSLISPFYFTTATSVVYLLAVSLFVQESRHKDAQKYSAKVLLKNRLRRKSSLSSFDISNQDLQQKDMTVKQRLYVWFHMTIIEAVEPIGKLWIKRTASGSLVPRINTILLIVIDTFFCSATSGYMPVIMLYAIKQYHWTSVELGYYVSIVGLGKSAILITMPFILTSMKKTFKFEVINNGVDKMDKTSVDGVNDIFGDFNRTDPVLQGLHMALSAGISPTIQNCILKYSSKKITGQIFAAHTQLRHLTMLFLPIIFLQTYSRTFDDKPNLILSIPFALSVLSMTLLQFVKLINDPVLLRRESEVDVPKLFKQSYGSVREQRPVSQRKLSILNK
ncbi:hypothetical protein ACO0OL_004085 [Hanseniaspora opuntiae]